LTGKRAIVIARQFGGTEGNFTGEHCWARGYGVSTVGFELEPIRAYIRPQADADPDGGGHVSASLLLGHGSHTRVTAFEAALLIKPPAMPGVSDFESDQESTALP